MADLMLIEAAYGSPKNELDETATFNTDCLDEPEDKEHTSESETFVGQHFDLYDDRKRSQEAYMIEMNLNGITNDMKDLSTYANLALYNHIPLDTGAPKCICSQYYLQRSQWQPITSITLLETPIHCTLLYSGQITVFLIPSLQSIRQHGKQFIFYHVSFSFTRRRYNFLSVFKPRTPFHST